MSHAATNWAIQQRGLKPATKLVLWYLADRHNPDLGCFPSQDRLAADAELSRSSLNTHLQELEERGLIRRVRRHGEGSRRISTRYIFAFESDFAEAESHVQISDMEAESHVQNQGESHVQNLDTNPVREEPVREEEERASAGFSEADWSQLLAVAGYPPMAKLTPWWSSPSARQHVDGWLTSYGFTPADVIRVAQEARQGHDAPLQGPKGLDAAMARAGAMKAASAAAVASAAEVAGQKLDRLKRIAGWINDGSFVPQTMITNTDRSALVASGLCTDEKLRERGFY